VRRQVVAGIAQGRRQPAAAVEAAVGIAPLLGPQAASLKLLDSLMYR
jgi:hypothetical protein